MNKTTLLAIDTSGSVLYLGVMFAGDRLVKSEEKIDKTHGQILIKKIGELLGSAAKETKDISAIIVSTGPGSFTGLRIGIAAAKGMAVALEIPIIGISLFEIAAYKLKNEKEKCKVVLPYIKDDYFTAVVENGNFDESSIIKENKASIASDIDENRNIAFIGFENSAKMLTEDENQKIQFINYNSSDFLYLGNEKYMKQKFDELNSLEPLYIEKSQAEINFFRNQK